MKKLKKFDNSILNNFKDIRNSQILSFFVILFSTIINLFLIVRIQKIIDIIIKQDFLALKTNLIKTIPIIIIYSIIIFFEQYFLRKLFFIGELKSTNFFYNRSLEKSLEFHSINQSGVVLSKITNDSKRISNYLSQGLVLLFSQIGILLVTLIVMASYNILITTVMLSSIIICFILVRKINKKISQYNIENQRLGAEINQNILQSLIGIFDIKQLKKEHFFSQIIENKLFIDKYKIGKKISLYFSLYVGMACFVSFVLPIISIILSSYLVYLNKLTVGSILAIYSLTKMLDEPIRSISIQIGERQITIKTQERLKDIYTIEDKKYDNKLTDFKSLDLYINKFSYDNEKTIFSNININIEKNDICLIKGQSGCGKTTLANLICNILNTDHLDGDIKWNKSSILKISNNIYFEKVLKSNQNTFIFEGSIKENILLDDYSLEENLYDVLKICNLEKIVNEKGLDFKLEENGKNISGGQKQRISLARILIRKPQLLILDEITSSLDKEISNEIAKNVIDYIKQNNITAIIISHKDEFDKYCNKYINL